ncbi:substrate-binding periplasmic protein [Planctobacterium marinum]|uniref:Solute-binding protein family 3/N-terminal domain-containing protein n=1 Tax=Planctobacterium marinum TaxID=1631968 RepID=A0AA48I7F7_9ALTE|nr:hypothetical protein MACH26_28710 [Planctobacterium marinum]
MTSYLRMKGIALFLLLMGPLVKADTLHFATDAWCPYICDVQSEQPGILVEATNQILLSSPYSPNYLTINWAQSINLVRKGELDGLIGTYQSDAPDFVYGEQAFLQSQMCFFVDRNSNWEFTDLSSLNSRTMAFMNGYSYGEVMDTYIAANENQGQNNVMRISGDEDLQRRIALLNSGRVNTLIEDKRVFAWFIKWAGDARQFRAAGCLKAEDVYIGFSPALEQSARRAALLDSGLQQLHKNGELSDIIRAYSPDTFAD